MCHVKSGIKIKVQQDSTPQEGKINYQIILKTPAQKVGAFFYLRFMTLEELHALFLEHPTICTDTRKITENCLFFALKGPNFNGNAFAQEALKKGAAYAVIDEESFASDRCILFVVHKERCASFKVATIDSLICSIGLHFRGRHSLTADRKVLPKANAIFRTSFNP